MNDELLMALPDYTLGFWEVKPIYDNTSRWRVVNTKTGEEHIGHSPRSAEFLCKLFNDQSRWYDYKYDSVSVTYMPFDFNSPTANWKLMLGEESNTWFQFYMKKGPNTFQRWLYKKVFGIVWEKIE